MTLEYTAAPAGRIISSEVLARILLGLFVFSGSFVLFEPSPYEVMFIPTALMFMLAGVTVPRAVIPLILLLVLFMIGGGIALVPVLDRERTKMYMIISAFMCANAIFFAVILSNHTPERFAVIRSAYIASAVVAALLGIIGYFGIGGTTELLTLYGRSKGLFKDPNVFSPFLVFGLILLLQPMLMGRMRQIVLAQIPFAIMILALLLAFSRAAWAHFLLSAALYVFFLLCLAPSARLRVRVVTLSIVGGAVLVLGLIAILSIPDVREVFFLRASLTQSYDTGTGGRFSNQLEGIQTLFRSPLGIGPLQFAHFFRSDSHNVYINAFASYGWLGGFSYFALILLTWAVGLKSLWSRSPYTLPLAAALATFIGVSLQGFVVDTDHWRHMFLLLGCVWGLSAAAARWDGEQRRAFS